MSNVRRAQLTAVLLGLAVVLSAVLGTSGPAVARTGVANPIGSDAFVASSSYRGDFPDPSVLRVGSTWYAYSTTVSSLNLPVLASTDLVHWRAVGEGLKKAPRWAATRRTGKRTTFAPTWAPSVARFGNRYVHAYAVRMRRLPRMCLSLSVSKRPSGGFVDRSKRPFICYADRGAIDPSFFTGPDGKRYLLWKSEQTATQPSSLWITIVSSRGTARAAFSKFLLTTQDAWESPLIENPSMIFYGGRYYLFYSGGSYANDTYATGYAVCDTPLGPCTRPSAEPLLSTGEQVAGTGGASAFVDLAGQLRLAYAAWDYGNTGYPTSISCASQPLGCAQRRLHVATLGLVPDGSGLLTVVNRG